MLGERNWMGIIMNQQTQGPRSLQQGSILFTEEKHMKTQINVFCNPLWPSWCSRPLLLTHVLVKNPRVFRPPGVVARWPPGHPPWVSPQRSRPETLEVDPRGSNAASQAATERGGLFWSVYGLGHWICRSLEPPVTNDSGLLGSTSYKFR